MRTPEEITAEIIAIHEKVETLKRKAQTLVMSEKPADKASYLALKAEWGVLENSVVDLVIERRDAFRHEALRTTEPQQTADTSEEEDTEEMEPMTHDEEMDMLDAIAENASAHSQWGDRDLPDRNEDGEYLNGGGFMP